MLEEGREMPFSSLRPPCPQRHNSAAPLRFHTTENSAFARHKELHASSPQGILYTAIIGGKKPLKFLFYDLLATSFSFLSFENFGANKCHSPPQKGHHALGIWPVPLGLWTLLNMAEISGTIYRLRNVYPKTCTIFAARRLGHL